MQQLGIRLGVCMTLAAVLTACDETSAIPPTAPSPLSPDKIGELTVACPAGLTVQSQDGQAVPIDYGSPTVSGGQAPVSTSCTPEAGSAFPVGSTEGRCTASDTLGQAASCTFTHTVLSPPMLGVTRVLAFGDSLTAGVTSPQIPTSISQLEPMQSYPFQLEMKLGNAYMVQDIFVFNAGVPGEGVLEATPRLQTELALKSPEVVLLMQGVNDLGLPANSTADTASAFEGLIALARGAGVAAVAATTPPVRALGGGEELSRRVVEYNGLVRSVAARQGVPLIDIERIIENASCPTHSTLRRLLPPVWGIHESIPCVGLDHLHLTAEGYGVVADAFFDHLVATYDQPVTPTDGSTGTTPVHAPRRRSPGGLRATVRGR